MAVEASIPQLGAVVVTALIDSINPCAIGVLILLVSILVGLRKKDQLLKIGLIYIGSIFVTYLVAGLGMLYFVNSVPLFVSEYISIGVGLVIIAAGLIEIKDYFWYGQGISLTIPADRAKQIHDYSKNLTIPGVIFLGAFVAAVELPCTGAPYLAIILLLSQNFDLTAFGMLVLYNFIFVLPLIIILFMVYSGTKITAIKKWKQSKRGYMRLAIGLLLVGLGWLLMLIANGTFSFI